MKVICTLCCKKWEASKYVIVSEYVCPHCDYRIKRGIPLKLERRKKRGKGMSELRV